MQISVVHVWQKQNTRGREKYLNLFSGIKNETGEFCETSRCLLKVPFEIRVATLPSTLTTIRRGIKQSQFSIPSSGPHSSLAKTGLILLKKISITLVVKGHYIF